MTVHKCVDVSKRYSNLFRFRLSLIGSVTIFLLKNLRISFHIEAIVIYAFPNLIRIITAISSTLAFPF